MNLFQQKARRCLWVFITLAIVGALSGILALGLALFVERELILAGVLLSLISIVFLSVGILGCVATFIVAKIQKHRSEANLTHRPE